MLFAYRHGSCEKFIVTHLIVKILVHFNDGDDEPDKEQNAINKACSNNPHLSICHTEEIFTWPEQRLGTFKLTHGCFYKFTSYSISILAN